MLLELMLPPQTGVLTSHHWVKEQYRKLLGQSSCQVTTETEVGTLFSVMARKILPSLPLCDVPHCFTESFV